MILLKKIKILFWVPLIMLGCSYSPPDIGAILLTEKKNGVILEAKSPYLGQSITKKYPVRWGGFETLKLDESPEISTFKKSKHFGSFYTLGLQGTGGGVFYLYKNRGTVGINANFTFFKEQPSFDLSFQTNLKILPRVVLTYDYFTTDLTQHDSRLTGYWKEEVVYYRSSRLGRVSLNYSVFSPSLNRPILSLKPWVTFRNNLFDTFYGTNFTLLF